MAKIRDERQGTRTMFAILLRSRGQLGAIINSRGFVMFENSASSSNADGCPNGTDASEASGCPNCEVLPEQTNPNAPTSSEPCGFAHFHCHTEYSFMDGIIPVRKLCEKAAMLGMKACAITDHGHLRGVASFYFTCKEFDIKPIIGMEAYVCPDSSIDIDSSVDIDHRALL